jgi:hypothetical protein
LELNFFLKSSKLASTTEIAPLSEMLLEQLVNFTVSAQSGVSSGGLGNGDCTNQAKTEGVKLL